MFGFWLPKERFAGKRYPWKRSNTLIRYLHSMKSAAERQAVWTAMLTQRDDLPSHLPPNGTREGVLS